MIIDSKIYGIYILVVFKMIIEVVLSDLVFCIEKNFVLIRIIFSRLFCYTQIAKKKKNTNVSIIKIHFSTSRKIKC